MIVIKRAGKRVFNSFRSHIYRRFCCCVLAIPRINLRSDQLMIIALFMITAAQFDASRQGISAEISRDRN